MDHLSFLCILKYSLPGPSLRAPSLVCVRLITGLCVEADGSRDGKQKKQEGRGQLQLAEEKKKVKNLLLKYIFGWRALNVPYTFTFLSLIELQFQTCGRLWAKKGKTARDSDALVGDRTLWKTLMVEQCWGHYRCNAQMTLWDINETQM